jgi:ribokinase
MRISIFGEAFVDTIVPFYGTKPGETYHRTIKTYPGGLLNIALHLSRLGTNVNYFGKVGNDTNGKFVKRCMTKANVKINLFIDEKKPTGICVSLIDENGDRILIADRGANDNILKKEIDHFLTFNQQTEILYTSGYSLVNENSRELFQYLIQKSYENGTQIFFNPGSSNIINEKFREVIKNYIDVLILNLCEAQVLCQENSIEKIYEKIVAFSPTSIITLGGDGCSIVTEHGFNRLAVQRKQYLDTTGAGDAFSAGFMVAKSKGMSNLDSAKFANRIADEHLKQRN